MFNPFPEEVTLVSARKNKIYRTKNSISLPTILKGYLILELN
jgi:hypothetical protein